MALRGLPREKVLATVVHLLENTLIRVGNADYAKQNKSYGLTTLRDRHVDVDGGEMRFAFRGKSGRVWKLRVHDRRIARIVKACQDIPGQHLFQYYDEAGERHPVTSSDVNSYLREATGQDITAKDFRTWHGTLLAAMALREFEAIDGAARTKKAVRQAVERVAARLGNTPTICRKCYVHPEVVNAYLEGGLLPEVQEDIQQEVRQELRHDLHALKPEEAALLGLLQARLAAAKDPSVTLQKKLEASIEAPMPVRPKSGAAVPGRAAAKTHGTPRKARSRGSRSSS
jgi:DNA topoisomerase-1